MTTLTFQSFITILVGDSGFHDLFKVPRLQAEELGSASPPSTMPVIMGATDNVMIGGISNTDDN